MQQFPVLLNNSLFCFVNEDFVSYKKILDSKMRRNHITDSPF